MAQGTTLFAVDLAALREAWTHEPLARAAARHPRGRLGALLAAPAGALGAPALDLQLPGARAFAGAGTAAGRRAFDALLEDRAAAALYDAPPSMVPAVFAAIASVAKDKRLEAMHLDEAAEPVYPPDLVEGAAVSGPIAAAGLWGFVVWIAGAEAAAAHKALGQVLSLPVGAFPTPPGASGGDSLFRDVAEALHPLLEGAARPRHALVASRS